MWCFHDRLKEFTFSEQAGGQTIKMCPECTAFDAHRIKVLKTGHVDMPDTKVQQRWDIILDDAGLSMNKGTADWLMFDSDIVALQPHKHPIRNEPTPLDDHLWLERQKAFSHTQSMPRLLTNYCVACKAYLPVNHVCEIQ